MSFLNINNPGELYKAVLEKGEDTRHLFSCRKQILVAYCIEVAAWPSDF